MKSLIPITLLCILISSTSLSRCGEEQVQAMQIDVKPCTYSEYVVSTSFENVSGTVVRHRRQIANFDTIVYHIEAPDVTKTLNINLGPCNLPKEAMQDGLKIKFSGHLLTQKNADPELSFNVEALAFELTQVSFQIVD